MSSWLDNQEREYVYDCPQCGQFVVEMVAKHPDYMQPRACDCGAEATYVKFLPLRINLRGKVAFDQNGRKAYQITDGKGNVRYVSATRQRYEESGDIVPQYTRAYADHLVKTGNADQLEGMSYKTLVAEREKTRERKKRVNEARDSQLKSEDKS